MNTIISILTFLFSFPLLGSDIAIVTLVVGDAYKEAVNIGTEIKQRYASFQSYDFILIEESLDPTRPIPWSKIPALLKVMENPQYKWIFWTDADTMFMNFAHRLEELADENYELILSHDHNTICTGNFLIKNSAWSREFLKNVYAHTECLHHKWWDNQALIVELESKPELMSRVKLTLPRLINCYPREFVPASNPECMFHKGDFIIHFAGVRDLKSMKSYFQHYLTEIVYDPHLPAL